MGLAGEIQRLYLKGKFLAPAAKERSRNRGAAGAGSGRIPVRPQDPKHASSDRLRRASRAGILVLALVATGGLIALASQQGDETADSVSADGAVSGALYKALGFRLDEFADGGGTVPRIFLPAFPDHMTELPSGPERKAVFLATMLPHVLKVNEVIAADRNRLLDLKAKFARGGKPTPGETAWLDAIASHYGLADAKMPRDMDRLLLRVQVIPPSLALTQAAIESGWGGSRFATEGNAAFGQRTWDGDGIIPARRRPGATHRVRDFDHLFESVASYMHNLNTHPAYEEMRRARAALVAAGKPLTGAALAPALENYSERRAAYVADVLQIMTENRLGRADSLSLAYAAR